MGLCFSTDDWEIKSKLKRRSTDYFSVIDHFLSRKRSRIIEKKVLVPLIKPIQKSTIL